MGIFLIFRYNIEEMCFDVDEGEKTIMAEQVFIQFRADKALKLVKGLPFDARLPEDGITRADGIHAFHEIRRQLANVPEMSLDEMNAEIAEIREERKAESWRA